MADKALYDQPSDMPTRKVKYGVIAGAVGYLLTMAGTWFWGPEIPEEVANAIPVVAALLTAYVVRDREQ